MYEDVDLPSNTDNINYLPQSFSAKSFDSIQNHPKIPQNLPIKYVSLSYLHGTDKMEFEKELIQKTESKLDLADQLQIEIIPIIKQQNRLRLAPSFFNEQQQTVIIKIFIIIIV